MILPVWQDCVRCSRMLECADPFPTSGDCAHPGDHVLLPARHAPVVKPSPLGMHFATTPETQMHSLYERHLRGLAVDAQDFQYIRGRMTDAPPGFLTTTATHLLYFILSPGPERLVLDFTRYYGIDQARVREAFHACMAEAVVLASPDVVAATVGLGASWQRHLLDFTRWVMWLRLGIGYPRTDHLKDRPFRERFEREWHALQPYLGELYDFRVVPRISPNDFVRYQGLRDPNPRIRRAVSSYFSHQAKAYPYFFKPWFPQVSEVAFGRRLRQMYAPLAESVTRQALANMGIRPGTNTAEYEDVLLEVWREYDEAWKHFQFYWTYPGKQRPFGIAGMVGFAETPAAREAFDELLAAMGLDYRSGDFCEIAFAHYISDRLTRWVARRYPPDAPSAGPTSLDSLLEEGDDVLVGAQDGDGGSWGAYDPDALPAEQPALHGPDGTPYLTIHQVARMYGLGVDQLRRMDRAGSLPATRVTDVFEKPYPLGPATRLYAQTEDLATSIQTAQLRAETRSSSLPATEITRQTAANHLNVPISTLRRLERKGKITPRLRGRSVAYTKAMVESARELLAAER